MYSATFSAPVQLEVNSLIFVEIIIPEMFPGTNEIASNNAGGVLGGISTGQDIEASIALKPTSSITTPGNSINEAGESVQLVTKGRHDPCVGIRAVPIAEAMMAITLMDHYLRHRGQNADVELAAHLVPASRV